MFTSEHYEYLSDTILNDPMLSDVIRKEMFAALIFWFDRDFPNFNKEKWMDKWENRFR